MVTIKDGIKRMRFFFFQKFSLEQGELLLYHILFCYPNSILIQKISTVNLHRELQTVKKKQFLVPNVFQVQNNRFSFKGIRDVQTTNKANRFHKIRND